MNGEIQIRLMSLFISRYVFIFAELPDLYWRIQLAGYHDSQCLCLPLYLDFTVTATSNVSTQVSIWRAIATGVLPLKVLSLCRDRLW
jgi:hypothetical protein